MKQQFKDCNNCNNVNTPVGDNSPCISCNEMSHYREENKCKGCINIHKLCPLCINNDLYDNSESPKVIIKETISNKKDCSTCANLVNNECALCENDWSKLEFYTPRVSDIEKQQIIESNEAKLYYFKMFREDFMTCRFTAIDFETWFSNKLKELEK